MIRRLSGCNNHAFVQYDRATDHPYWSLMSGSRSLVPALALQRGLANEATSS